MIIQSFRQNGERGIPLKKLSIGKASFSRFPTRKTVFSRQKENAPSQ